MTKKLIGFTLLLASIIWFFIFEGSYVEYLSLFLAIAGIGMITRSFTRRGLILHENPKTTEDLRHWGKYKSLHYSPSTKNDSKQKYRVVLENKLGIQNVFLMPEIPPSEFYWIDNRCVKPKELKRKQFKLYTRM